MAELPGHLPPDSATRHGSRPEGEVERRLSDASGGDVEVLAGGRQQPVQAVLRHHHRGSGRGQVAAPGQDGCGAFPVQLRGGLVEHQ